MVSAGSHAYSYDLNGNQVTRDGNDVTWTSDNYPSRIENGSKAHDFYYDGQRNRWKQVYTNGSSSETTIHVGGLLEKRTEGTYSEYRHYIQVGGRAVALYTRPTSGAITTRYLLHDHQGSVAEITDSAGGAYVGESFGAFGERRDPADWSGPVGAADEAAIAGATQRGYTFHGHLESGSLIHMNGRVADSLTGRFLSADPYVPYPGLSQSFNRYAYVHNNPLTFSDPSGFTLGPGPLWRLDSGGFEFGGFGGLDIDGGISLSFIWGGRSHSGQSRPLPVKGCFVPGTSGCYGKAPAAGLFDMLFDLLSGPLPGYGAYEDLVLYYNDPDGYGRFDNEIILVQDVGAAVLYEFVLLPIEEALQGRLLSALCKVAKLCRVAERFGGRLLELAVEKGRRLFRRKIEGVPNRLPDDALVCRGGTCTADRFRNGRGVTVDDAGNLQNVSVNSAPGQTVEALTQGIPNNQVGVTTVGNVRAAGGNVVRSPNAGNPNHATLSGISPEEAERLFTPTIRNPNR